MPLLELVDQIDGLLSSGASIAAVRSQLVVLREQLEAQEQHLSALEAQSQDEALTKECERLRRLLSEAHDTIERQQYEITKGKQNSNERAEIEQRILLFLAQNARGDAQSISRHLGVSLEKTRFHLQELEKAEMIYGRHFYT